MEYRKIQANIFLLLTAAIWGFAFVAQRVGAQYLGTFTFNGIRFALGSLSLVPLILLFNRKSKVQFSGKALDRPWVPGMVAGVILFTAATLQQMGVEETGAGKAAFITGLYIVLVPLAGLFLKQKVSVSTWAGVGVTAVGLYLLSVTERFTITRGDLLVLVGALFWTFHILVIDVYSRRVDGLKLSAIQFLTCAALSLGFAVLLEPMNGVFEGVRSAMVPILYGGICSVGIAYTLQVFGQKYAEPSHAAIILSLETVFASIGGWLILRENLGFRGYLGCALMLIGMLLAQIPEVGEDK
ncbi:MAG TPA: DMT family transporter [Bacillota bacterium]|nr:DMT family transporter [Bacillota bacterium]HPT87853.1 DMT family transporter [Bacillota bacterium]